MRRIVWVHGIGEHRAGYSKPWRDVFNPFLDLKATDYLEVLWEPVMEGKPPDGLPITVLRGEALVLLPEGDRYLGFLFARAELFELGTRHDDRWTVTMALHYLADCPLLRGDYAESEKRYGRALAHAARGS